MLHDGISFVCLFASSGAALLFPLYRRYCRDWAPCMSCCSSASSPPPCLSSSSPSSTQGTEGFLRRDRQPVALVSRKAISHDVFLLTFALPATDLPLGLPVGRHIRLFAKNDNFGKDTWLVLLGLEMETQKHTQIARQREKVCLRYATQ
eukprot:GHVT01076607.1.p1 GENE.GHVT01076607.1~~GHVT01076607.1.p1  ORF type:complete len:149 (+),score=30.20 GHVT01076607.1:715-1161(+)